MLFGRCEMVGGEGLLENVKASMAAAVDNPIEVEQVREPKRPPADQGMVGANRGHQVILDQAHEAQRLVARPSGHETDREIEIASADRGQNVRVDAIPNAKAHPWATRWKATTARGSNPIATVGEALTRISPT